MFKCTAITAQSGELKQIAILPMVVVETLNETIEITDVGLVCRAAEPAPSSSKPGLFMPEELEQRTSKFYNSIV